MAYNYRDRLDHVGQRMKVLNPETVSYRRDGQTTSGIVATPTKTDNQELIPGAAITNIRNQDWVFDTADIKIGGVTVEPEYGDEIIRANNEVYRVCAYRASTLENESPFSYITTKRTRIKVHSERIS